MRIFFCAVLSILLAGCAMIKEAGRGIAGISTQAVEETRKDALKKTFKYDSNTCYNKVEGILKGAGAYIYAKDSRKPMLAVYVSEIDTTPVGIFFTAIDSQKTEIAVSSPAKYAKELIARQIFTALSPEPSSPKEGQK